MALWHRGFAPAVGSPERQAFEIAISIEEAYADAYTFACVRDAQPRIYAEMFMVMHRLHREPAFAIPLCEADPLCARLGSPGLDDSLSLPMQVEAVMGESEFQLPRISWPQAGVCRARSEIPSRAWYLSRPRRVRAPR